MILATNFIKIFPQESEMKNKQMVLNTLTTTDFKMAPSPSFSSLLGASFPCYILSEGTLFPTVFTVSTETQFELFSIVFCLKALLKQFCATC